MAPAPHAERQSSRPGDDPSQRQPPREQVEALVRRCREDPCAEVLDELGLDPVGRPALRDALADLRLDPLRRLRVRLVERRVAGRAHDLPLEIRERRARMDAGGGGPGKCECAERERGDRDGREPDRHESSAASTPRRNAPVWSTTVPTMCSPTSRPRRSTKYVSGTALTP